MKRTFAGLPIQLFWQDLYILECVLSDFGIFNIIIELGTGSGTSALFFSNFAYTITYDNEKKVKEYRRTTYPIKYYVIDIFKQKKDIELMFRKFDKLKIFLFCDNGDKPREFREFAPMLKPGDFIAVHDYGVEIKQEDIDSVIKENNLEEVGRETAERVESLIRVYKK